MNTRAGFALGIAVALSGASASNADPLSIFQPTHVQFIAITPADARGLQALPALEAFGTVRETPSSGLVNVASAREASRDAGFLLRLPANVPSFLAQRVRYQVSQPARAWFTFDPGKAAGWARAHNVALLPIPAGLGGATFVGTLQPVTLVTYGTPPAHDSSRGPRRGNFLTVMQAPLPTIVSNGASLQTLAQWFSAQAGVPPHLAAEVRAIGDPTQTLPIPIRFDRQSATSVYVDGVQGLAIGDETGIGSAIVWTKAGKIYALGGTLTQSQALAFANTLR
jgi:hypothetical protein